jgi:hypothetical protein
VKRVMVRYRVKPDQVEESDDEGNSLSDVKAFAKFGCSTARAARPAVPPLWPAKYYP